MTVIPGNGDDDRVAIGDAVAGAAVATLVVAVAGAAVLTATAVGAAVRTCVAGPVGAAVAGGGVRIARASTIADGVGGNVATGATLASVA